MARHRQFHWMVINDSMTPQTVFVYAPDEAAAIVAAAAEWRVRWQSVDFRVRCIVKRL